MSEPRVCAVVVAWNRAEMLVDTLDALGAQTYPLAGLIVVDNASTDASPTIAASHTAVTEVVTMTENLGGAGGFAAGIARALHRGADIVWIMDDDTVPTPTALEELMKARANYPGTPAVLACRADWIDGREHPMNAPRTRYGLRKDLYAHAAAVGGRQIRTASFVAIAIDARAIKEDGLPNAAYFLWNDDFEYTARLLRRRIGLYIDAARVEHRTKVFGNSTADPGPRFYNEVRNKFWAFTRSPGLGPVDKLLFGSMTTARWILMFVRSKDRAAAWTYFTEGARAGCETPPSTSTVLAGTPVGAEVARIEKGAGRD